MTILTLSRILEAKGKEKLKIKPDYDPIIKLSKVLKIIPTGFIKVFVRTYNLKMSKPEFNIKSIYIKQGRTKWKSNKDCSLLSYSYDL